MSSNPTTDTTPDGPPPNTTFAVDENFDLIAEQGRFATTSGDDAIIQDQYVALATPEADAPGSDPIRPEYGRNLFRALGQVGPAPLRTEIARTVGPTADPRVERIASIDVDYPPDNPELYADVMVVLELVDSDERHALTFPVEAGD